LAQAFLAVQRAGKEALNSDYAAQFHDWRKKAKRLLFQSATSGKARGLSEV
jgi:hypothetical protein